MKPTEKVSHDGFASGPEYEAGMVLQLCFEILLYHVYGVAKECYGTQDSPVP
jgi:hypothetical protein